MKNPDISIIIPVYNVEPYIEECLRSVMRQDADATMECLVVDDRGSDNSMQVAREVIDSYNGPIDFRIIARKVNGGLSAARNSGIREARGRYVYFLDSDDIITDDCVMALFERATQYPAAQIVAGKTHSFPDEEKGLWLSTFFKDFPDFSDDVQWIRSIYLSKFPVVSCNKLIKRDFITYNNLYFREGILHEDEHWTGLSYSYIAAIGMVNKTTYLYRVHEGSITTCAKAEINRIFNMHVILTELFARDTVWDEPMLKWVNSWLYWFKSKLNDNRYLDQPVKSYYSEILSALIKNRSIPFPYRFYFAYEKFVPSEKGKYFLYHRILKLTD